MRSNFGHMITTLLLISTGISEAVLEVENWSEQDSGKRVINLRPFASRLGGSHGLASFDLSPSY
jgi:hypothetical protein